MIDRTVACKSFWCTLSNKVIAKQCLKISFVMCQQYPLKDIFYANGKEKCFSSMENIDYISLFIYFAQPKIHLSCESFIDCAE